MKKRPATRTVRRHHAPHFYVIFGVVAFFIGVFATFVFTKVVAQTNDVINACVNKVGGNIRIVKAGDTCSKNEDSLSWNQQGPTGPQGDPGASSATGIFSCGYCVLYPVADKFKGKDFSYAQIYRSDFQGADLAGVIFKGANMSNVDFSNTNLTGADFTDAGNYPGWDLGGLNFANANLTNTNFTNTNLRGVRNMSTANVTGTIWKNTVCPDGTNSNNNGNTCAGHF